MKKMSKQAYAAYVKEKTPVHNVYVNMAKAFVTGGTICLLGQVILNYCKNTGMKEEIAGSWTSLVLVLISVLLTGFNIYPSIAKWGLYYDDERKPKYSISGSTIYYQQWFCCGKERRGRPFREIV